MFFLPLSMFTPLSVRCFRQLSHLFPSVHPESTHISLSIVDCVLWEGLDIWSCPTQLNLCDWACWPQYWLWQIAVLNQPLSAYQNINLKGQDLHKHYTFSLCTLADPILFYTSGMSTPFASCMLLYVCLSTCGACVCVSVSHASWSVLLLGTCCHP